MNNENNYNEDEQEIFANLGNIVGIGEIEARKIMGDEQYEKTVALMEANSVLGLQKDAAQVKYFRAIASMQKSIGFFFVVSSLLAISWSLYFWSK